MSKSKKQTCTGVGSIREIYICKFPRGVATFEDLTKWIEENPEKYQRWLKRNKPKLLKAKGPILYKSTGHKVNIKFNKQC